MPVLDPGTYVLSNGPPLVRGGLNNRAVLLRLAIMYFVPTLVERCGSARSFHVDSTSIADIAPNLRTNLSRESKLMTDEARHYMEVGREYESHDASTTAKRNTFAIRLRT
jgi:hypothetical protein